MTVVQGSALICAVKVGDWASPSRTAQIHRHVLSAPKPSVLFIPAGYANGFMSLSEDAKLMFFSTATVEESRNDDIRFHSRHWDPWPVVERGSLRAKDEVIVMGASALLVLSWLARDPELALVATGREASLRTGMKELAPRCEFQLFD